MLYTCVFGFVTRAWKTHWMSLFRKSNSYLQIITIQIRTFTGFFIDINYLPCSLIYCLACLFADDSHRLHPRHVSCRNVISIMFRAGSISTHSASITKSQFMFGSHGLQVFRSVQLRIDEDGNQHLLISWSCNWRNRWLVRSCWLPTETGDWVLLK